MSISAGMLGGKVWPNINFPLFSAGSVRKWESVRLKRVETCSDEEICLQGRP